MSKIPTEDPATLEIPPDPLEGSLGSDPVGDLVRRLRAQRIATSVQECLADPVWCRKLAGLALILLCPPRKPQRVVDTLTDVFGVYEALTYTTIRDRIRRRLEAEGDVGALDESCLFVGALAHGGHRFLAKWLPDAAMRKKVRALWRVESRLVHDVSRWHVRHAQQPGLTGAAVFDEVTRLFRQEFLQLREEDER